MKKEIMKKWVKALRSGGYEQGKGCLVRVGKRYDEFCCLGVLADLYMQEVGDLEVEEDSDGVLWYDNRSSFLPNKVLQWGGVYVH